MPRGKRKRSYPDWDIIREMVVAGIPYKHISERFYVTEVNIRQRASREKWLTPTRIKETAARFAQQLGTSTPSEDEKAKQKIKAVEEIWAKRGEAHRDTVAEISERVARWALAEIRKDPSKAEAILAKADKLKAMDDIGRRSLGLSSGDTPQVNIALNALGGGAIGDSAIEIEAETVSGASVVEDASEV